MRDRIKINTRAFQREKRMLPVAMFTLAALPLAVSNAIAQEKPEDDQLVLEELVVTGVRSSLKRALDTKRDSDGIVDALVAEDIGDFPDLNITESLQRLPGVTLAPKQEGSSEGQSVSVRSLPANFTRVTIDGNSVVTASQGGRQIELDVFASELFNGAQVYKTPEARLAEGGLSSVVNLTKAKPFDYDGFKFSSTLKGVHNEEADDTSPRFSALISDTWGDWGGLVSVSSSETVLREDKIENIFFQLLDFETPAGTVTRETPFLPRSITETRERDRLGLTAALQYRPSDNFELNFDVVRAEFDDLRSRNSFDIAPFINPPSASGLSRTIISETSIPGAGINQRLVSGVLGNITSRSENVYDLSEDELTVFNAGLDTVVLNDWNLSAKISRSEAETREDFFRILYAFRGDAELGEATFEGIQVPTFRSLDFDVLDPNDYDFNQLRFLVNEREAEETSVTIDLSKDLDSSFIKSVQTGIRYSDFTSDTLSRNETINPSDGNPAPAFSQVSQRNDGFFRGASLPAGVPTDFLISPLDQFLDVAGASGFVPAGFLPAAVANGTFGVEEETIAVYGQANFEFENGVRGNFGLRYVDTDQVSSGGGIANGNVITITSDNSYSELLPSLNLSWDISDTVVGRFAASSALARPNVNQLSPGFSGVIDGSRRLNSGNPELEPILVDQIDIGIEWYFANESVLGATYFRKEVEGLIETEETQRVIDFPGPVFDDTGDDISGLPFTVSAPVNRGEQTIDGFEIFYQQPLHFLPGAGIQANYTTASISQSRTPLLTELASRVFLKMHQKVHLTLLLTMKTKKLSARVAYNWVDDINLIFFGDNRSAIVNEARGQIDLSVEYDVSDRLAVTFEVINLTEERTNRISAQETNLDLGVFGGARTLLFGLRYNH